MQIPVLRLAGFLALLGFVAAYNLAAGDLPALWGLDWFAPGAGKVPPNKRGFKALR